MNVIIELDDKVVDKLCKSNKITRNQYESIVRDFCENSIVGDMDISFEEYFENEVAFIHDELDAEAEAS